MVTDLITTGKWIVANQSTVAEMVDEILIRFDLLDLSRKSMFSKWLRAHGCQVKNTANIRESLTARLESVQQENIQSEYHLIMIEIDWWRKLDERSLTKLMLADSARNDQQ